MAAGDPFRRAQVGEKLWSSAAQQNLFVDVARRVVDSGAGPSISRSSVLRQSRLLVAIQNDNDTLIPAFGLVRWSGPATEDAVLGGLVPPLVLRCSSNTHHYIGIALNLIAAADPSGVPALPAGVGLVQIAGVTWALALGPITPGDRLTPNSDFKGVRASAGSNVEALQAVDSGVTAIIPVRILAELSCQRQYNIRFQWAPDGGSVEFDLEFNAVTETVTLDWDADPTDLATAINAHAQFVAQSVTCTALGVGQLRYHNCLLTLPDGAVLDNVVNLLSQTDVNAPEPYPSFDLCGC